MATTLGWFFGGLITSPLTIVISGLLVGVFQWLVLQGRITRPWRWIFSSFCGWIIGYFISVYGALLGFEIFDGAIFGLTVGIAQWIILRNELRWTGWWIIFSIVGWTTGLTLLPGVIMTGTVVGVLSGIALEILLRYPRLIETQP